MKTKGTLLLIVAIGMFQGMAFAAVGYVNHIFWSSGGFQSGDNLFGNPLGTPDNSLSGIVPHVPDGATVWLWDPSANDFLQSSIFTAGAWSVNLVLPPGQGALLRTFTTFTNTFVGQVLNPDGSLWRDDPILPTPAPFSGPAGVYLLSSKLPATLSENTVFDYILGRSPKEGEQFTRLDPLTQTYLTTTFLSGAWNNGNPMLPVGDAAFFKVVPEPATVTLTLVGLFLTGLGAHRRRRKV